MEKEIIVANRYKIIRKLGEGGTAKVYLAYDQIDERNVSLKILKKENIDDRKVKKFKKEAETLALLDDENIVKIYDVGQDDNLHYIAAEYIDGMTLKDYIRTCSPIPVEEIVKLSQQILHGVKHAHERGVVHKDLKTQNILLDEHKNVKITDFGIADIMDEDVTRTQSLMGTPQYIAPEILNRESLTAQSDLYSVGIVMYEMCVMQVPFVGEKAAYIMIKQMSQPLPSIIAQRADIPQSLENVIIKATAKKLNNRYQNAKEMIEDLNHVFDADKMDEQPLVLADDLVKQDEIEKTIDIGQEKIDLSNLKDNEQQKKDSKRKQKRIIIVAIVLVLLLIGGLIFFNNRNKKITMPDLVRKTQNEAYSALEPLGISSKNVTIKYEFSKDIEQDKVIRTQPPAGDIINKKTPIVIYLSQGPEGKKLDNYVGKIASDVKTQLENDGYVVTLEYVENDAKADTIIAQSPGNGSLVKPGDTITLTVSSGQKKVVVPNFTNMTKDEVDAWSKANQISITYETTCNNTVEAYHVISQSVAYDTEINKGDQISISLSTGACPVVRPQQGTPAPEAGSSN